MREEMPVYVFTGFLEAGKTSFIRSTLEDERFNSGERTLLILCEEGEEELDPSLPYMKNVFIETLTEEAELTSERLEQLEKKHRVERVLIEYNGMWQMAGLYSAFPEHWLLYQELMFADATTFAAYNVNMRERMVDKLSGAEMVVFNRFTSQMDQMDFHKQVRAISRRTQIAYEYKNGYTEYDEFEDPLPFDINATVIDIELEDYALWYRDVVENPKNYEGKTVHLTAMAGKNRRLPEGSFVFGRPVMTCCEADTQFMGFVCQNKENAPVAVPAWYELQAKVVHKFNRVYGKKGPVLMVEWLRPAEKPKQEIATFY